VSYGLIFYNADGSVSLDTSKIACSVYKVISSPAGVTATYPLPDLEDYRFFVVPIMSTAFPPLTAPVNKTISTTPTSVSVSGGNYAALLYVLVY
jgi:hypothetical protein